MKYRLKIDGVLNNTKFDWESDATRAAACVRHLFSVAEVEVCATGESRPLAIEIKEQKGVGQCPT